MTLPDLLSQARALILEGYCNGSPARDDQRREVSPLDVTATRYDALGALWCVHQGFPPFEAIRLLNEAHGTGLALCDWCDTVRKTAVLVAFDYAIAIAKARAVRSLFAARAAGKTKGEDDGPA